VPRELLPLLGANSKSSPNKWPYCSQSTTDDVKAMRFIRSKHSTASYTDMWRTLQSRLHTYATTGKGSIAEAIVHNDCYWKGELAYEVPSGKKSQALKRRYAGD
jgi:hypothetical protein